MSRKLWLVLVVALAALVVTVAAVAAPARQQVTTAEDEQINQASALWARPKSEITEAQYHEFYKHVAHDFEPPLAYVPNRQITSAIASASHRGL